MAIESNNFLNLTQAAKTPPTLTSVQVEKPPSNANQPKLQAPLASDTLTLSTDKKPLDSKKKGLIAAGIGIVIGAAIFFFTKGKKGKDVIEEGAQAVLNQGGSRVIKETTQEATEEILNNGAKEATQQATETLINKGATETLEEIAQAPPVKIVQETIEASTDDITTKTLTETAQQVVETPNVASREHIQSMLDETQKTLPNNFLTENYMNIVHSASAYEDALKVGGFEVEKVLAVGGESIVYELKDGNILKLAATHCYDDIGTHGLYAPELKRGVIKTENTHFTYKGKEIDSVNYLVQKKGDVNVSPDDIEKFVKNEVDARGYKVSDMRDDQFAYFINEKGEKVVKAVDLGCLSRNADMYYFEEITKAAKMPADIHRDFLVEGILRDKIFGKSFDYETQIKLLHGMRDTVNQQVEQGTPIKDAVNAILKQNNKAALRTF